jgi:Protein of unknown function (DUF3465)
MKKLILLAVAVLAGYSYFSSQRGANVNGLSAAASSQQTRTADSTIADAIANHRSNVEVSGEGTVTRVLSDDNSGSRHQRFIVTLPTGQTVLVAHNIDLAPRVSSLREGDAIQFSGEYEWNEKGGVLHWTHRDPSGSHVAGWLKHQGQTYQ